MHPYETYILYKTLRLHFNSEYDYIAAKGKLAGHPEEKFNTSNDRPWIETIARKYRSKVPNFLLANLSEKNYYVRDLATLDECEKNFAVWEHRRESMTYQLKQDRKKIEDLQAEIIGDKDRLPKIVRRYIAKEITKDSLAVIIKVTDCLPSWNEDMKDNFVWNRSKNKIVKYVPFVPIKPHYRKILLDNCWRI